MSENDKQRLKRHALPESTTILHEFPSARQRRQEPSFLIKVADSLGAKEWMWKSFGGAVLALIVIPPTLEDIASWWQPKLSYAYEMLEPYELAFNNRAVTFSDDFIVFSNSADDLPVGTVIAPQIVERSDEPDNDQHQVEQLGVQGLRIWRVGQPKFAHLLFRAGERPFAHPHSPSPLLYGASGCVDAMFEARLHLPPFINQNLMAVGADIPSDSKIERLSATQRDMLIKGGDQANRAFFTEWMNTKRALLIGVPAKHDVRKTVYVINPAHPDFSSLNIVEEVSIESLAQSGLFS